MNPRWKSVWITPAASGAVAPAGISQARVSFGPAVRNVLSPRAWNPARASRASPGSPRPSPAAISAASSSGSSASSASVFTSRKIASAGATSAASRPARPCPQAGLVHVEHVQERLGRQQVQLAQVGQVDRRPRPPRRTGSSRHRAGAARWRRHRPPAVVRDLGESRFLGQPGHGLVQRLQVGQDQLGRDRVDVARGRHVAVHMTHIRVGEDPHHLADRVGLADVGQGTGCPGPGPATRRAPGRRCPRNGRWRARPARSRTARPAPPAADRGCRRCPRSARWSRTGSSTPARSPWSAR